MISLTKRKLAIAAAALTAITVGLLLYARNPMQPLTTQSLEAAREKWTSAGPIEYEMEFEMMGGLYHVHVQGNRVVNLTRNNQPTTSNRPEDFTVEGIFDTLERELDILNRPTNPFGGDSRTTLLRVSFHPKLGYVQRYLRAVGGTGQSSSIEVTSFTPR